VRYAPVNNIVDVTNYVMLETGSRCTPSMPTSSSTTLSCAAPSRAKSSHAGRRRTSTHAEVLVIADTEKAIGIAGVMGGLHSEVTAYDNTSALESAHSMVCACGAARGAGAFHEASRRFERWVDPNGVRRAADRAANCCRNTPRGTDHIVSPTVTATDHP
jgi:phenylalanyl-tRNA synthetase beta chain